MLKINFHFFDSKRCKLAVISVWLKPYQRLAWREIFHMINLICFIQAWSQRSRLNQNVFFKLWGESFSETILPEKNKNLFREREAAEEERRDHRINKFGKKFQEQLRREKKSRTSIENGYFVRWMTWDGENFWSFQSPHRRVFSFNPLLHPQNMIQSLPSLSRCFESVLNNESKIVFTRKPSRWKFSIQFICCNKSSLTFYSHKITLFNGFSIV